ncbi:sensor histidine kinase [Aquincola sp. S2]|uniref:histidine kinase n=1 Tax=Pseudaquabacterium terrae TaxID=2732868 RepID=A0ABX2EM05_9BURK|nr:sensor histidine kinase [Aquabacterium terrae]NRF69692.1 sensor histidine kinase [Aquabacterium terrae]
MTASAGTDWSDRWQSFASSTVKAFHRYANWLVGISWRRFAVLSILLLVSTAILKELPPFRWKYTETVSTPRVVRVPTPTAPPAPPAAPSPPREAREPIVKIEKGDGNSRAVDISIDERGVRITPRRKAAEAAASAASAAAAAAAAAESAREEAVDIRLPAGTQSEAVREAVAEARRAIRESIETARREAADAAREAADAAREAAEQVRAEAEAEADNIDKPGRHSVVIEPHHRVRIVEYGDFLPNLALLWILASAIIKITYKRQIQAEAQAAQAVETAEAEALKRQVVEARMAAMQAQVEPHFLFNTLASIDHLIEVDPKRASQMQKNLIALLRASMPTMREASDGGVRDLSRELAVIRPYLEILKVRMEERLETHIDVPEGLVSAEFPPMMVQTLVENAIKHGLEPKPEGGKLTLKAEIVHGKLAVTVSDTGLGFGRAATAGTGVGLANIRERLQLLYGPKAGLTIAENEGGGTRATITVPYRPIEGAH